MAFQKGHRGFRTKNSYKLAGIKIGEALSRKGEFHASKRPEEEAYRARKWGAEGSYSFQQWEELKKKYNYMCLCCKQQEPFIRLTTDHVVPLSRGGSNDISNIQPLCRSCNGRKFVSSTDYRTQYANS